MKKSLSIELKPNDNDKDSNTFFEFFKFYKHSMIVTLK